LSTSNVHPEVDTSAAHGRRRRARMSRFLVGLLAVTALAHVPVALAVAQFARRAALPSPGLIGVVWALAGVTLFVGRARAGMPDRRRHTLLVRIIDIPYFVHWCAAIWTLLLSVVATLVSPIVDLVRGDAAHLPMQAYAFIYGSGLLVSAYGVLVRRRWYRTVEREVRLKGLDPRLDGLRIAHLSDLHIGTHTPRSWGLRWSETANRREPDLAVVTGDMLTSGSDFVDDVAAVVGALRARLGVFASMGNHDYFGEGELLASKLRAAGVSVLRNEGVVVERNGARLWVAAIDDTWTRRDDMARAMRDRPEGIPAVLLAHDPQRFDEAAERGVDLVLAGHTHGGQFAVPFFAVQANLAHFAYPYTLGFYRRARSVLYVHPGLGTTGPPMRLGAAPEVTILVLRAA
jgi:predicted MPP superfamily phosphohydrolase